MAGNQDVYRGSAEDLFHEDLTDTLYEVNNKRSTVPEKLENIEVDSLNLRQKLAESIKVLPELDRKKVVTKYTLKNCLPEEKEFSESLDSEETCAITQELCKKLPDIQKTLEDVEAEKRKE